MATTFEASPQLEDGSADLELETARALGSLLGDVLVTEWDALPVSVYYKREREPYFTYQRIVAKVVGPEGVEERRVDIVDDEELREWLRKEEGCPDISDGAGLSQLHRKEIQAKTDENARGITDINIVVEGKDQKIARQIEHIVLSERFLATIRARD